MRKAVAAFTAATALGVVATAQAQRTNEEIDRNGDGIVCVNDNRGGFGTTLTDNNTRATASGCPASSVPVVLNP